MALAQYTAKLRLTFHELEALYHALKIEDKISTGEMSLSLITTTSHGSPIYRVINSLGCQVATVHRFRDALASIEKVFPESLVVGNVMCWRLGHD